MPSVRTSRPRGERLAYERAMGSRQAETRYQELKRYVAFTDDDARLLQALGLLAAPHYPRIAQEFYERIREHEEAHAVFTGDAQIARLNRSLQSWLGRALGGTYDERYFEETQKIGRVHVQVGLPQRYMFTAMALIRVELTRIAGDVLGAEATKTQEAITRLLDLELAIMMEPYRDDFVDRVQRLERNEKVAASRALLRAEDKYVNAVEVARVLVVGLDARGDVQLFNREAERVTAFGREEVQGRPFDALLQEDRAVTFGDEIRRAAAGQPIARDMIECAVRTKSGKYRDLRWQLAYAPSTAEDDVVLFLIGQDTTDELAIQEKALQHQKLASVGTLAAGLAHEIRNPLNGALLHVAFLERALKKTQTVGEMLEAVQFVGHEITRLGTLVSQFLDFARPRPLQREEAESRKLCERVMTLVAQKAKDARVTVTLDLPRREVRLSIDPPKIEQVLVNLLNNAIEAALPPGGQAILRVRRLPRSACFEVEDDGPGLSDLEAPIFDPFFSTKSQSTSRPTIWMRLSVFAWRSKMQLKS